MTRNESIAANILTNRTQTIRKATRLAASLTTTAIATTGVALAQSGGGNFCSTAGGQFIGGLQTGVAGIALAAFVIMLLITVVAKMLPFKGASKIGNMGAGGFVSGILILTVGISLLQWALSFTPFAASMSCGSLL